MGLRTRKFSLKALDLSAYTLLPFSCNFGRCIDGVIADRDLFDHIHLLLKRDLDQFRNVIEKFCAPDSLNWLFSVAVSIVEEQGIPMDKTKR